MSKDTEGVAGPPGDEIPAFPGNEFVVLSKVFSDEARSRETGQHLGNAEIIGRLLQPDDFSDPFSRDIFRAIGRVRDTSGPIEAASVLSAMRDDDPDYYQSDMLKRAGLEVAKTHFYAPHPFGVRWYCAAVLEAAIGRELEHLVPSSGSDVAGKLKRTQERIGAMRDRLAALRGEIEELDTTIEDATRDTIREVIRKSATGYIPGVIQDLDERIGGPLPLGNLVIVGALPSNGKSLFQMQALMRARDAGHKCLFISQEMSRRQIGERGVAMFAELTLDDVRTAQDAEMMIREIDEKWKDKQPIPVVRVENTVRAVCSEIEERADMGFTVFAVDYLQLLRSHGESTERHVANAVNEIQTVCKNLDVTVYLASQLTIPADGNKPLVPLPGHLRYSKDISAAADALFMLRHPWREQSQHTEIEKGCQELDCPPNELLQIFVRKLRDRPLPDDQLVRARLCKRPLKIAPIPEKIW